MFSGDFIGVPPNLSHPWPGPAVRLCGVPASNSTLHVSPFPVIRRAATSGDSVLPLPYIVVKELANPRTPTQKVSSKRNMDV